MRRTKGGNKNISEAGQWIVTAYNLSLHILECEDLIVYHDQWSNFDQEEEISDMIKDIADTFISWLENTEPAEILTTLHYWKIDESKQSILIALQSIIPKEYHHYLKSNNRGIASALVRPIFPAFAASKRQGAIIQLTEPIIKKTGNTTMEISGTALFGRDFKTLFALSEIMYTKEIEYIKKSVYFRTTYTEICQTMGISNPWSKPAQQAVFNSLLRMRGCNIIWTDEDDRRSVGGILSQFWEVDKGADGRIEINLDADYINLFTSGYINLTHKELKLLYSMTDSEIAVFIFLKTQSEFRYYGRFGGKHGQDVERVYDRIFLQIGSTKEKPYSQKRYELDMILGKLRDKKIVKRYRLTRDHKIIIDNKPKKVVLIKQKSSKCLTNN